MHGSVGPMFAMSTPVSRHHHQGTEGTTEKKKKKEEKDREKRDKEKDKVGSISPSHSNQVAGNGSPWLFLFRRRLSSVPEGASCPRTDRQYYNGGLREFSVGGLTLSVIVRTGAHTG